MTFLCCLQRFPPYILACHLFLPQSLTGHASCASEPSAVLGTCGAQLTAAASVSHSEGCSRGPGCRGGQIAGLRQGVGSRVQWSWQSQPWRNLPRGRGQQRGSLSVSLLLCTCVPCSGSQRLARLCLVSTGFGDKQSTGFFKHGDSPAGQLDLTLTLCLLVHPESSAQPPTPAPRPFQGRRVVLPFLLGLFLVTALAGVAAGRPPETFCPGQPQGCHESACPPHPGSLLHTLPEVLGEVSGVPLGSHKGVRKAGAVAYKQVTVPPSQETAPGRCSK